MRTALAIAVFLGLSVISAAQSPQVGRESALKPGVFPYAAAANLGAAVNFENEIDTHRCFPLLVSTKVVAWLYRAYLASDELLVQRCKEYGSTVGVTPGNRSGEVNEHWERVTFGQNPSTWHFTPIEAPDWGAFANPGFCDRFVAYWGFRGEILVSYVYDLRSRRVAATQTLGASNLETDNTEVMPEPKWNESCAEASFDARPAGKAVLLLKSGR
jgi:hypothetical protein